MHSSSTANLYLYPHEADYTAARPLDPTWHRMDSSVRETDEPFEIPELAARRPDGSALIYLSLGSLGSADVGLMQRLVEVLGRTPHRYIVSKGPLHAAYELADNMVGAEFLPQTSLMPHVDAVITHGGNNTVTEAMHFGKPMVVLPLFWDQYDNAQRMDEVGFGVRLPTYSFTDDEMRAALDRVLERRAADDARPRWRRRSSTRGPAGRRRRHRVGGAGRGQPCGDDDAAATSSMRSRPPASTSCGRVFPPQPTPSPHGSLSLEAGLELDGRRWICVVADESGRRWTVPVVRDRLLGSPSPGWRRRRRGSRRAHRRRPARAAVRPDLVRVETRQR